MDNAFKHTAHYQLSKFLQSDVSKNYPLDGIDVAILSAISYMIDSGPYGICFAQQDNIASIARVAKSTVSRRVKKLVEMDLIETQRKPQSVHIIFKNLSTESVVITGN